MSYESKTKNKNKVSGLEVGVLGALQRLRNKDRYKEFKAVV